MAVSIKLRLIEGAGERGGLGGSTAPAGGCGSETGKRRSGAGRDRKREDGGQTLLFSYISHRCDTSEAPQS